MKVCLKKILGVCKVESRCSGVVIGKDGYWKILPNRNNDIIRCIDAIKSDVGCIPVEIDKNDNL